MAASVRKLLADHGEAVTFRRVTVGTYQPGSGTVSGDGSFSDETVSVAFTTRDSRLSQALTALTGETSTVREERRALLPSTTTAGAALTKTPQVGDLLVGVDNSVKIVSVREINVSGSLVGYSLGVQD